MGRPKRAAAWRAGEAGSWAALLGRGTLGPTWPLRPVPAWLHPTPTGPKVAAAAAGGVVSGHRSKAVPGGGWGGADPAAAAVEEPDPAPARGTAEADAVPGGAELHGDGGGLSSWRRRRCTGGGRRRARAEMRGGRRGGAARRGLAGEDGRRDEATSAGGARGRRSGGARWAWPGPAAAERARAARGAAVLRGELTWSAPGPQIFRSDGWEPPGARVSR